MIRSNPSSRLPKDFLREIDPLDLGIALAMIENGFSESDVESVLGYLPDLEVSHEELEALERRIELGA